MANPIAPTLSRAFAFVLLVASAFLLVGTIIVARYNLMYSTDFIAQIFRGEFEVSRSQLQAKNQIPEGVMPFMQDLSLVSPGLLFFTLLCTAHGAFYIFRSRVERKWLDGRRLPFPNGYKIHYVQLGLLGTIVGFTFAFMNVQEQGHNQIEVLLAALGTALWSTLVALFLAYVLCPVIEGVYRGLYRLRTGEPYIIGSTSALVEEFERRMMGASQELKNFSVILNDFATEFDIKQLWGRLVTLEQAISTLSDGNATFKSELENEISGIKQQLSSIDRKTGSLNEEVIQLKKRADRFIENLREIVK